MFFDRPSSVEGPSKHFHPGSPRIKASLGPGCSGVIRDGPCWVRLWCDLGFTHIWGSLDYSRDPDHFNFPRGVSTDKDLIYVADHGNLAQY